MAGLEPPSVSVTLSIDPPTFAPGTAVNISVTATSHASIPITIFTWPNIFNLRLAQKRANFTCVDLNTGDSLWLEITKGPKRSGFNGTMGGIDDPYFTTLEPEQPETFTANFGLANRKPGDRSALAPGHRYRFAVREGEEIAWWREGRREDVLAPADQPSGLGDASGPPIRINSSPAVEFEVV